MSRHHHRPAHKRGWTRIRAAGDVVRRGGGALAAVSTWKVLKCTIRSRCLRVGRTTKRSRSRVSELSFFARHQLPDPARLAWARFLQEEFPC